MNKQATGDSFQAPNWARVLAWLLGLLIFVNETFIEPAPRFPLLVFDVVYLMGASPKVMGELITSIRGGTPRQGENTQSQAPPSSPSTENKS